MPNQAILFAEDTPSAYNPEQPKADRGANTLHIAGAAWQIPVFWLFCFAEEDLVDVETSVGRLSTLVAEMGQVRRRLAERDVLGREFFPAHAGIWSRWRAVIESVDRRYLKLDPYEIWLLYKDDEELGGALCNALDWFDPPRSQPELDFLLGLAGIEDYNHERRTFHVKENECPERFLVGFGLDVEVS